jgi:hypothetical protein
MDKQQWFMAGVLGELFDTPRDAINAAVYHAADYDPAIDGTESGGGDKPNEASVEWFDKWQRDHIAAWDNAGVAMVGKFKYWLGEFVQAR